MNFDQKRNDMVDNQLIKRGISSDVVLNAMRNVPRHMFVPENMQKSAYEDCPLPIGLNQTISQPYIVAYMTEHLDPYPGMKILEIGTGSGYQAAILAHIGCDVYTIELHEEHANKAKQILTSCGYDNINIRHGNGFTGWPENAPFDAIIVTAAPDSVPPALIDQLKNQGKMIIPVGNVHSVQSLKLITKDGTNLISDDLILVRFVPMINTNFS